MVYNVHVCTDLSGGVRVPPPRTRPLEKIKFNSVQSYQIHIQRIVYISNATQLIIFGHFLLIFFNSNYQVSTTNISITCCLFCVQYDYLFYYNLYHLSEFLQLMKIKDACNAH